MADTPDYDTIIFSIFLFIIFMCGSLDFIQNYRLRIRSKKWHGATEGAVTDIRQDFRYVRFFHKRWFEYPVVTFKAGTETYRLAYPRRKKGLGYYEEGETYPIIYNEDKPEEFIFSDEFSGFFYYARQVFFLSLYLASLWFSVDGIKDYYLSTHELLFEDETWEDLEDPLAGYKNISFHNVYQYDIEGLDSRIEEAAAHFSRIDGMIEEKRGEKSYDAYRERYLESAIAASRNLAQTYSDIIGTFFEKCELEGEKENVYQSVYSGFLEQICPLAEENAGCYSMEELSFLIKFIHAAGLHTMEFRDDPEESIGLSLAVFYAKLDTAISRCSYGKEVKNALDECFPAYVYLYMDQVDEYILGYGRRSGDERYPPLNREAVWAVYQYMVEQYRTAESFQDALWNGSVFAKEQLLARKQADPSLKSLARNAPENDPFTDFDSQAGKDAFFNFDGDLTSRSPRYYLFDWKRFLSELDE